MEIHNNIIQLSDEWWALREKRMTASHAQAISACGAGLKTYIEKIMQEYYSEAEPDHFSNKHTDRGNELENQAGMVYSFEKKITVKKIGFVTHNEYVGCSPDLLAGDDGLCEIKCLADKGHFALIIGGKPESKYVWQAQCQMLICGKQWCDLTHYNPNFKQNLLVYRILPDEKKFEKLRKGFVAGEKMIKEIEEKMNSKNGGLNE